MVSLGSPTDGEEGRVSTRMEFRLPLLPPPPPTSRILTGKWLAELDLEFSTWRWCNSARHFVVEVRYGLMVGIENS